MLVNKLAFLNAENCILQLLRNRGCYSLKYQCAIMNCEVRHTYSYDNQRNADVLTLDNREVHPRPLNNLG